MAAPISSPIWARESAANGANDVIGGQLAPLPSIIRPLEARPRPPRGESQQVSAERRAQKVGDVSLGQPPNWPPI